jgi:hypothetical protein
MPLPPGVLVVLTREVAQKYTRQSMPNAFLRGWLLQ